MKRYKYSVAIVVGLLAGTLTALWFGNTLTGVLSGILASFVASWLFGLRWRLVRLVGRRAMNTTAGLLAGPGNLKQSWADQVRKQQSIWAKLYWIFIPVTGPIHLLLGLAAATLAWSLMILCLILLAITYCLIGLFVRLPIWCTKAFLKYLGALIKGIRYVIVNLMIVPAGRIGGCFFTDAQLRKIGYCLVVLLVLFWINWTLAILPISFILNSNSLNGISMTSCLFFIGVSLTCLLAAVLALVAFFCLAISIYDHCGVVPIRLQDCRLPHLIIYYTEGRGWNDGAYHWIEECLDDGRKPLASVLYMLGFRTLNALAPVIWLVMFVYWLPRTLACTKGSLAALTAAILSAINLGTSYTFGWINTTNPNFWLSLAITVVFGTYLGVCIYQIKLFGRPEFPKLPQLSHRPKTA